MLLISPSSTFILHGDIWDSRKFDSLLREMCMCEREDRISDPTGILDPSAYASDSSRHAQEKVEIDPTGQD